VSDHAISWRRRIFDFDRAQRRPQRFVLMYAAFFAGFWIATVFAFLFDVLGADGREPLEQPIREFIFQAIRAYPLAVSTGVALVLTIAFWRFVSPGRRPRVSAVP
jgi:hypothetical protein